MLPWKSKECEKKLERVRRFLDVRGLKMVTLTMCESPAAETIEKYGVSIVAMPFERNPFTISSKNLRSLMGSFAYIDVAVDCDSAGREAVHGHHTLGFNVRIIFLMSNKKFYVKI